jgi:DNA-binding PadR family transcriptional regulator
MPKQEHIPWDWLILGILADSHHLVTLADLYKRIEDQYHEMLGDKTQLINPTLLDINSAYGDRPKFQHTVRAALSIYNKKGWVEHVEKGVYRLTDRGLARLQWVKNNA